MIILTGGAGFIGSAFLAKLNEAGADDILVVDDLSPSEGAEKWRNLNGKRFRDYLHKDQFAELLDSNSLHGDVTAVVHLGACSSTTETDAEYMLQNNYRYTKMVAEWSIARGVRFIYASSAATYGDGAKGFSDSLDELDRFRPLNVYALSKQLFDRWALQTGAFAHAVGLRFFNVYGPNEYHKGDMRSVVHKSFEQINATGSVKLFKSYRPEYGDGEQVRDFVYVRDCSDVMWWLLENPSITGLYNLGTGTARSWNALAQAVFGALGKAPSIEYIDMPEALRPKYQYLTEAKMDSLRNAGCPIAFRSLEQGVSEYVQGFLMTENPYL
ncbi:MAG: ADP-glyceromanno-heptose 6-epimerase [Bdellovibrionales bacterium]|nr:ADP-glyceromanno-heptose 6-epimerase [Bdellovibrionales bacterium]